MKSIIERIRSEIDTLEKDGYEFQNMVDSPTGKALVFTHLRNSRTIRIIYSANGDKAELYVGSILKKSL